MVKERGKCFHELFSKTLRKVSVTKNWMDSMDISLYNSKDARYECNSCRVICLLSIWGEICIRVVLERIKKAAFGKVRSEQCNFVERHNWINKIFSVIDRLKKLNTVQKNFPLCECSIGVYLNVNSSKKIMNFDF